MNPYIGHDSQLSRVEEHRLVGGKGDGMRLLEVNNGIGMELTVSADRCADISRLLFRGINMSYFAPCGYVSPVYYDSVDSVLLKSFAAGFLTTCGLQSVGIPCVDNGEHMPMHGSIGNTPVSHIYWIRSKECFNIIAEINDEGLFSRKTRLIRNICISLVKNEFTITDTVTNMGYQAEPIMLLYHFNIGYPLLDEDSIIKISSDKVLPRNDHAAADIENWARMEIPQAAYKERCYYHVCRGEGFASIYQPKLLQGLAIHYDPKVLDCFTQWKMMGIRDYVLGLEPGNSYPDGREAARKNDKLKMLAPLESMEYQVHIEMLT